VHPVVVSRSVLELHPSALGTEDRHAFRAVVLKPEIRLPAPGADRFGRPDERASRLRAVSYYGSR